ncbi:Transcriptional regulator, contains XRE-family HTH domain [Allochromatium warmingii]|uniref:Transcriptional regulator, contains XRE-family HTH domain n=1 Tax=Allochromatium warmingii TaxID=61595 RepID=A0A1H3H3H9_ALLWA|nr:helix-turn-helix domain-containing protein [Allochromatium warmingii]SDY09304.1 Transcriptional regulator, contains XRE-family HTH domain [Allochromatium warmingii]
MQIHEKLKVMRLCRGWSQEEMAEKLGYSANGYAKIERGETDIKVDRLGKIAEAIGVDLQQLLNLNDKNVFNVIEGCHYDNGSHGNILLTETQCAHELEKYRLLLQERDKEIANLHQQIAQLKEINALLKANAST